MQENSKYEKLKEAVETILDCLGEAGREDTRRTPERVARMLLYFSRNGGGPLEETLSAIFPKPEIGKSGELVLFQGLSFMGFCPHHLLPYFGEGVVAYVPNGKVVGLSKVARLVEAAFKGLNLQEEVTRKFADVFFERLSPKGLLVRFRAEHLCMTRRGAKALTTTVTTVALRGTFGEEHLKLLQPYITEGGANAKTCRVV